MSTDRCMYLFLSIASCKGVGSEGGDGIGAPFWHGGFVDGKRVRAQTVASNLCLRFASCMGVVSGGGNGRGWRSVLAWRFCFFQFVWVLFSSLVCLIFGRVFRFILGAFGVHFGSHSQ